MLRIHSVMTASPRRRRRYAVTRPSLDEIRPCRAETLTVNHPVSRERTPYAVNDANSQQKCSPADARESRRPGGPGLLAAAPNLGLGPAGPLRLVSWSCEMTGRRC